MYPSVRATIEPYLAQVEGWLRVMYPDDANAITTGLGNKIDSPELAMGLPWRHGIGGPLATPEEIGAAWETVKNAGLAGVGGGSPQVAALTDLRLDDDGIQALINSRLATNEPILRQRFTHYDSMPANGQRALHAMAWAMGPEFKFPKFEAAMNEVIPDFITAANESGTRNTDVGNVKHNAENKQEFLYADQVVKQGLPFDQVLGLGSGGGNVTIPVATIPGVASASEIASLAVLAGKAILGAGLIGGLGYLIFRGFKS